VRFPRQLPWPLAMELLLTARHITAAEALRMGLVNRVVPLAELMPAAEEYARMVAELSPTAVQALLELHETLVSSIAPGVVCTVQWTPSHRAMSAPEKNWALEVV